MKRQEQAGKTLQTLNAAGDGGQGISIALPIQSFDPTLQEPWREEETLRWGETKRLKTECLEQRELSILWLNV